MDAGGGAGVGQRALPHSRVTLQLELWAAPRNSLELDQTNDRAKHLGSLSTSGGFQLLHHRGSDKSHHGFQTGSQNNKNSACHHVTNKSKSQTPPPHSTLQPSP